MRQTTAKLFKTGGSQAVRLPAEFRFSGTEVLIRKDEQTGEVILAARPEANPADEAERKRRAAMAEFLEMRRTLTEEDRQELARHPFKRPLNVMSPRRNPFADDDV